MGTGWGQGSLTIFWRAATNPHTGTAERAQVREQKTRTDKKERTEDPSLWKMEATKM